MQVGNRWVRQKKTCHPQSNELQFPPFTDKICIGLSIQQKYVKIIKNRGDRSAYFLSGSPGYQVIKEGGIKWRHQTRLKYNQPDKPTSSDRGQFPGLNAAKTKRRRRRRLKLRNVSVCAASSSSVVTLSTSPLLTLAGQEYWSILGGHVSKQFLPY